MLEPKPLTAAILAASVTLPMEVLLSPRRIARWLLVAVVGLTAIHVAMQAAKVLWPARVDTHYGRWIVHQFNVAQEYNVPTLYQCVTLLACSVLLGIIAVSVRPGTRYRLHWTVLALVFLYLSLDDMLQWHEHVILPTRTILNASGALYFTWVVPYGVLVLVFAASYLRFLLALPRPTRIRFALAGIIYVVGALCLELPEGILVEQYGRTEDTLVALETLEEILEMVGIMIFLNALLSYIASQRCVIRIGESDAPAND